MPANFAIISCLQSRTKLVAVNSQPINRKNKQLNRYNHIYSTYPPDFCLGFSTFLLSTFFAAVLFHCCPRTREFQQFGSMAQLKSAALIALEKCVRQRKSLPKPEKTLVFYFSLYHHKTSCIIL